MVFPNQLFAAFASIAITVGALPLDSIAREIVPRQKSYAIINVDGGSTQPAQATTVVEATKTIETVNPAPTITQQVTTTLVEAVPAPAPTTSSSQSTSSSSSSSTIRATSSSASVSSSTPASTPKPVFVTVTVGKDDGPTEYYDNGMWHTRYRIKSFAAVPTPVVTASAGATSPV